jgi:hypothetical protein
MSLGIAQKTRLPRGARAKSAKYAAGGGIDMADSKGSYAGKVDVIGITKAPLSKKIDSRKGAMIIKGKDLRTGKGK